MEHKILSFKFQRVLDQGAIRSILVTVRDVTKAVQSARQVAVQEGVRERQFSLLWEILQCDYGDLEYFLKLATRELDKANEILREDSYLNEEPSRRVEKHREKAEAIFRLIHNTKSHAGSLQLESISSRCEKIEAALNQLRGLSNVSGEQFLAAVVDIAELRNSVEEIEMLTTRMSSMPRRVQPAKVAAESPADRLTTLMNQTAQSAADRQNKKVKLDTHEAHFKTYPAELLGKLEPALVQLVRNSVKHGIEAPEERVALGKPSTGRISIQSTLPSDTDPHFTIDFRDDGSGLPIDEIKQRAVDLGYVQPEKVKELGADDIYGYLMKQGFTLCDEKDQDGGQGVGMDIVRQIVADELQGAIWIESQAKSYSEFKLKIPQEA